MRTPGSLGLTGEEIYSVRGLAGTGEVPRTVTVTASRPGGTREFTATVRIDTPAEAAYYRHGGILTGCASAPPAESTGPAPGSGPAPACQRPIAAYACPPEPAADTTADLFPEAPATTRRVSGRASR